MRRSYYAENVQGFLEAEDNLILGHLVSHHPYALEDLQRNAWQKQIKAIKEALQGIDKGKIYFEFSIPRMGKRVDNVLIIGDLIFVMEFKIGETEYKKSDLEQVIDYCLDLKNFHEGSHNEKLIPILIATKASPVRNSLSCSDKLFEPIKANQENLGEVISLALDECGERHINPNEWETSIYKPTPTIIEAAQALYKGHNVLEISRHESGAINLSKTVRCINEIIDSSKANQKKAICFLTGVPGAGKTLAGLNIANERMKAHKDEHAVFLSGNGPLVEVLREALARDAVLHAKDAGNSSTKKKEKERAVKFIQNIHHFRDDNLQTEKAPVEKVVVFDEAQRAWTKEQLGSFMRRKKGIEDFNMSEPEFLIDVMNRHKEGCVLICLVGGGQEINTGEAGVAEWLFALKHSFSDWKIYYSHLISKERHYLFNEELRNWLVEHATEMEELHLSVSMRSFRSEKVSELMDTILNGDYSIASKLVSEITPDFPIYVTRDLMKAKNWLKNRAKGSERIGILANSGAKRLRPIGIHVKNEIRASDWFLNSSDDVRSSNHLEDVATEFDIQGLEVDYVCLAWCINLFFAERGWHYQKFEGTTWRKIHSDKEQRFLLNSYRVLLTRARQGLIILVPFGDDNDFTRPTKYYDQTFEYFLSCGITEI